MRFLKKPISIFTQIETLENRGMLFKNKELACKYLSSISYYRLKAYTYPFQDNNNSLHPFKQKIVFEDIVTLYWWDSKLRSLLLTSIEKIEIALRTKIIYHYCLEWGNNWYENKELYSSQKTFTKDLERIKDEINRSNEDFIRHYKRKYTDPINPPAWMVIETISLGVLSRLFANLKESETKKKITKEFGLSNTEILISWFKSINLLRNICAHHGRVWNRRFVNTPMFPKKTVFDFPKEIPHRNKLYAQLSIISYLLSRIDSNPNFLNHLDSLLKDLMRLNLCDLGHLGFPQKWHEEKFWVYSVVDNSG